MGLGKILCVEYETRTRSELCRMLRNAGYETCEASTVEDGLNIIRTQSLDLVLCDIKLPDLDGFALINKVRTGNGPWSAVPFVFLTSLSGREDLLEGFRLGADDYLAKPVDAEMLLVRISAMLRQNKRVIKVVHDHHLDLQKELERAHNMQRDLLPSRETERVLERAYNIRLTSHYEPSSQLGGDIWGVQLISNNKFMFYLVDFSGHGVSAALNTFRLHSKIDSEPITSESPAQYLQGLNIWLCDHLPTGQYATTLLGIVDFSQRKFEYAAAGSTSPMRVNSKMRSVETGSGKGLPLGVSKKAVYENRTLDFCPGDGIFLYSDALVEHGRKDHMDLGREGVEQLVLNVADMSGDLIVDDILAPFLAMAPRPLSDDLTAVCCVWKVMS